MFMPPNGLARRNVWLQPGRPALPTDSRPGAAVRPATVGRGFVTGPFGYASALSSRCSTQPETGTQFLVTGKPEKTGISLLPPEDGNAGGKRLCRRRTGMAARFTFSGSLI
ncbi:hypothetical protein DSCA_17200 [Desulfosarcina alkanivorans]|uniref:Uncharacterized protein n=1 Tax=Desulfosarcina alkanivorans TaxID=571177 RepID=A0A5K7YI72_9BACT|nr:hypothetical protein DSCA_17200 [Desulfosarcina alkanivorans]